MNNFEILTNISKLQESIAKNYFESHERLCLMNMYERIRCDLTVNLSDDEYDELNKIFKKYLKFID